MFQICLINTGFVVVVVVVVVVAVVAVVVVVLTFYEFGPCLTTLAVINLVSDSTDK